MTDNISCQDPFVVSVPVLCFQIFTVKLIVWPKTGLNYAISIVNLIFGKYVLLFFTDLKSVLMFYSNIMKNSETLNKLNLLKICIQTSYPIIFCIICNHFYYVKMEILTFFRNH